MCQALGHDMTLVCNCVHTKGEALPMNYHSNQHLECTNIELSFENLRILTIL